MTTVTTLSPMNPNTLSDTVPGIAALPRSIELDAAPLRLEPRRDSLRDRPPGL